MARIHEYQAKRLLDEGGLAVPAGQPASSPEEARRIAESLGCPVVVKIQAWATGRKAMGGILFVETPDEAANAAERLLAMRVGNFRVSEVLVEEQIAIENELFVSIAIDDAARAPVVLLAAEGGTGVEDRATAVERLPCDLASGPDREAIRAALTATTIAPARQEPLIDAVVTIYQVASQHEARSLEVNPLVTTIDGRVVAADCRMTVDDYAVFRHEELGIDIARELDHTPTQLERIAYEVEQADHRGTFYFAQLNTAAAKSRGLIGFHGAGGGGSMMSMDAITNEGFTIANFCDTSGNPSAAKVYRAAKIILAQRGLVGYFGSGSGVASQEQFWSAYGLAKAFWEANLSIPAVIRLGGNSEDRAVEILEDACRCLPGAVEGYRKDDAPKAIAERFASLVDATNSRRFVSEKPASNTRIPAFVRSDEAVSHPIAGGRVWIDVAASDPATTDLVTEQSYELLRKESGKPVLAVADDELAGYESELIALEVELRRAGKPVVFVELDIPGLEANLGA